MRFSARHVAAVTGGQLHGPDVELTGASFDSRSLRPGQLFIPLVAERDGHDFISDALDAGAPAFLTSSYAGGLGPSAGTAIEVADTLQALMTLARDQREHFDGTVIGITGSVGKTSTKDLAKAALAASKNTWASERSFNNEQGLPITILNVPERADVLVLEMGMRARGEIADLCRIGRPSIGLVTRVADAHGERVGGIEGVALAKSELILALPTDGLAILNGDDPRVAAMSAVSPAPVMLFGAGKHTDVRFSHVRLDDLARASFHLESPWGTFDVRLGASGRHMVSNAAAALACVGAVGGHVGAGVEALADASVSAMRMEVARTSSGAVVINDAYNANPTSMLAALTTLSEMQASRRIAVLGLMAEIIDAEAAHLAVAEFARGLGIELIAYGTDLYGVAPVADPVAVVGALASGVCVLIKGSRVAGLEILVPGFTR